MLEGSKERLADHPIFIVGAPRSGTTLMRSVIDAHPNVFCPFWETGFFVHLDQVINGDVVELLSAPQGGVDFPLTRSEITDWARDSFLRLMTKFAAKSGKPRLCEKTPGHVFNIGIINECFPDALFIHMIRNVVDVVNSLKHMPWAPNSASWAINRWKTSILAGRAAGTWLGKHRYLEIRYEDFVTAPRDHVRHICEFIGEPIAEQMLQFHVPENNSWGVRQKPLQDQPINRHSKLGLFRRTLVNWKALSLMRELGYA